MWRSLRRGHFISLAVVSLFIVSLTYVYVNQGNALLAVSDITRKEKHRVRILYWTGLWASDDWGYGLALQLDCPNLADKCEFTSDHKLYGKSDALLFHMSKGMQFPPKPRPDYQKWIFATREAPPYFGERNRFRRGTFNTTFTYSRTSDINWEYGNFKRIDAANSDYNGSRNYAEGRSKMAAWFVSHCYTQSQRHIYTQKLQKLIDVDIFGKCGPHQCPKSMPEHCYEVLLQKRYKFYLAFENSICTDYVSDKVWKALQLYVVPIVLGGANYSAFLPPGSYIDVKDFESPKHLARYLMKLNNNDALYNAYFKWKRTHRAVFYVQKTAWFGCRICKHVYEMQNSVERADDVASYWSKSRQCIEPDSYYN